VCSAASVSRGYEVQSCHSYLSAQWSGISDPVICGEGGSTEGGHRGGHRVSRPALASRARPGLSNERLQDAAAATTCPKHKVRNHFGSNDRAGFSAAIRGFPWHRRDIRRWGSASWFSRRLSYGLRRWCLEQGRPEEMRWRRDWPWKAAAAARQLRGGRRRRPARGVQRGTSLGSFGRRCGKTLGTSRQQWREGARSTTRPRRQPLSRWNERPRCWHWGREPQRRLGKARVHCLRRQWPIRRHGQEEQEGKRRLVFKQQLVSGGG
jgi:hypothetical protein